MNVPFEDMILNAERRETLQRRMTAFYEDVDRAIAANKPTCWNRGACCKFSSYGHRLYITSVELAYFVSGQRDAWKPPTDNGACPYQIDGMCTAREHRPLGCRIFFCDENAKHWQQDEYENRLTQLKQMMAEIGLDYEYVEWLSALKGVSSGVLTAEFAQPCEHTVAPADVDHRPLPVIQ